MKLQVFDGRCVVEADRLKRWSPFAKFKPQTNDMLFAPRTGLYEMKDRVALIIKWRTTAEEVVEGFILTMMANKDLK